MSKFLEDFQEYEDCAPPGVRLPKIIIEDKYYQKLGVKKCRILLLRHSQSRVS